jgi:peptide deformylase
MAIREIITLPDKRLRLVSAPLAEIDRDALALMDDMLATMYEAPGIGLAAIQIGVPKRIVVIDIASRTAEDEDAEPEPDPIRLVNPEIVWRSEETDLREEGCLSIPEVYEEVERPIACKVRFRDPTGAERELDCAGLLARCVQHEVDHINGVLFIDHISRLKRDLTTRRFAKAARKEREEGAA